jgi:hypothetical protein
VAEQPRVCVVEQATDIPALVRSLGFVAPRPVLVLIGGAGGVSELQVNYLTGYLCRYVFPVVHRVGAVVVDGGTDSGVMRAVGRMRRDAAPDFPLIGVVAGGVMKPDPEAATAGAAVVEPHHTDLLVVPGEDWGDEVPWIGRVATAIAGPRSSVTLLVNGGEIAYRDMAESLRRDRPVVVLAGSGRTADAVAAAADGTGAALTEARQLAGSPLTVIVRYDDGPRLRNVLDTLLGPAIITG